MTIFDWFRKRREKHQRAVNINVGHYIRFEEKLDEAQRDIRDLKRELNKERTTRVGYTIAFTSPEDGREVQMIWGDSALIREKDSVFSFYVESYVPMNRVYIMADGSCLLQRIYVGNRIYSPLNGLSRLALVDDVLHVGQKIRIDVRSKDD